MGAWRLPYHMIFSHSPLCTFACTMEAVDHFRVTMHVVEGIGEQNVAEKLAGVEVSRGKSLPWRPDPMMEFADHAPRAL